VRVGAAWARADHREVDPGLAVPAKRSAKSAPDNEPREGQAAVRRRQGDELGLRQVDSRTARSTSATSTPWRATPNAGVVTAGSALRRLTATPVTVERPGEGHVRTRETGDHRTAAVDCSRPGTRAATLPVGIVGGGPASVVATTTNGLLTWGDRGDSNPRPSGPQPALGDCGGTVIAVVRRHPPVRTRVCRRRWRRFDRVRSWGCCAPVLPVTESGRRVGGQRGSGAIERGSGLRG
jgi:hypothetical protein